MMLMSDSRLTLQCLLASNPRLSVSTTSLLALAICSKEGLSGFIRRQDKMAPIGCSKSPYTSRALPRFWTQRL